METSINIISTSGSKKKQKSITNINPNATNEELSEVGQMINALSTNTYVETVRIDKQNVLEPQSVVTLHVDATEAPGAGIESNYGGFETIEGGVRIFFGADPQGADGYLDVTYTIE